MQHPVSLWDILPSSGRLTSDITSRTVFSILLQPTNRNLSSPFMIFKFKGKMLSSCKYIANKIAPINTESSQRTAKANKRLSNRFQYVTYSVNLQNNIVFLHKAFASKFANMRATVIKGALITGTFYFFFFIHNLLLFRLLIFQNEPICY